MLANNLVKQPANYPRSYATRFNYITCWKTKQLKYCHGNSLTPRVCVESVSSLLLFN